MALAQAAACGWGGGTLQHMHEAVQATWQPVLRPVLGSQLERGLLCLPAPTTLPAHNSLQQVAVALLKQLLQRRAQVGHSGGAPASAEPQHGRKQLHAPFRHGAAA